MPEFTLYETQALDGYSLVSGNTSLVGQSVGLISTLSWSRSQAKEVKMALAGLSEEGKQPEVGKFNMSLDRQTLFLRMMSDRVMALKLSQADAHETVFPSGLGYQVTQTDFWACLALKGPLAVDTLNRTCRLDLTEKAFSVGSVARTTTEGIATIVMRLSTAKFLLFCPRSFSASFAHAFERSLRNVTI